MTPREQRRARERYGPGQAPLYGLLLAGGKSSRMGKDKASLTVPGRQEPQLAYLYGALREVCERAYVSGRGRVSEAEWPKLPRIHDSYPEIGPLAGLLSAHAAEPAAAWLVVAVDLVNVTVRELAVLSDARDTRAVATAVYNDAIDAPEPLLAIYEPRAATELLQRYSDGQYSLRAALEALDVKLLHSLPATMLHNANTPEELQDFSGRS